MGQVSEERLFDEFVTWLAATTGKKIGKAKIPSGLADKESYAIVYSVTSPPGSGSFFDPEEDREFVYQITSVGTDARQVLWMSDKVRSALLGRDNDGVLTPMNLLSVNVQRRRSDSLGAIVPSGPDLQQKHDLYRIHTGV